MSEEKIYKPVTNAQAMGELADEWWTLRASRLAIEKEVARIREQESRAKSALLQSLTENKVTSVGGQKVRVTHVVKDKPSVNDWEEVYSYIRETGSFDILQRRIGERAVKDRWDDGVKIPGIVSYPIDEISYSKM
jgi:hypothetical protein